LPRLARRRATNGAHASGGRNGNSSDTKPGKVSRR